MRTEIIRIAMAGLLIPTITAGLNITFAQQPTAPMADIAEIRAEQARKRAEAIRAVQQDYNRFIKVVAESNSYTDQQKAKVARIAADVGQQDLGEQQQAMQDVLSLLYPVYRQGVEAIEDDELDQAAARFGQLTTLFKQDRYLAANACYQLARVQVAQEQYEQARALLAEVVRPENKGCTLHYGEALFLLGVSQAETLHRDQAIKTLTSFLLDHAYTAPERMQVGAYTLVQTLAGISDGSIEDIQKHMSWSGRRLALQDISDKTQTNQKKIVTMLSKLIEKAENKENKNNNGGGGGGSGGGGDGSQGGSSSGGGGSAGGSPAGPAGSSSLPGGSGEMGNLHRKVTGDQSEQWGEARQREREKVINAIKDKIPERYRELTEQYYKSVRTGKARGSDRN